MTVIKFKISSSRNLPKGYKVVSASSVAKANDRIKSVMQSTVRDYQKKQQVSLDKASQIVLNA